MYYINTVIIHFDLTIHKNWAVEGKTEIIQISSLSRVEFL